MQRGIHYFLRSAWRATLTIKQQRLPAAVALRGSDERELSGSAVARIRGAIYTRKSTEEGLEQEFNSLDAQREACAAYILSQRHEGWSEVPDMYDDGGYSGGTMERPALKALLAQVAEGKVEMVRRPNVIERRTGCERVPPRVFKRQTVPAQAVVIDVAEELFRRRTVGHGQSPVPEFLDLVRVG